MRHMIAISGLLAALALAAPQAAAQGMAPGQQGKFCLKGGEPATVTCAYETMASCEQAKKGNADQCAPNTGTTGAASGAGPAAQGSTTGMSPAGSQRNEPAAKPSEPSKNVR